MGIQASCLDVSLGPAYLASTIFEDVLARLVELFADVDDDDAEDGDGEPAAISEDSPIKREQLARAPRISPEWKTAEQPLRVLAANHAREAVAALDLGLSRVAIHHLRRAVDLVPLDVVLGYWLARLLIATGRRKECREGRRTALLCARVAGRQDENHGLETMASYILAARASERLGEDDVATEFARAAHEEMSHHWMAKIEYGRQLAAGGDKEAALEYAEEAFWLRPDSIRQLQRDPAFRSLGKAFDDFRARLRHTVTKETEQIAKAEDFIREFALQLGVSDTDAPPVQAPTDVQHERNLTILQLVHAGRRSARAGLQKLQLCAAKLSANINSFAFGTDKGLTLATRERIKEGIGTVGLRVADLDQQHTNETRNAKQYRRQLTAVARGTASCGVLVLAIAVIAASNDAEAAGLILTAIAGLGVWITWQLSESLRARLSTALGAVQRIFVELEQNRRALTELNRAMEDFKAKEAVIRESTLHFCKLVDLFETMGLRRLTFAPAVPMDRKGSQELVRADVAKASSLNIAVDAELLPAQLRFLVEASSPKSKYWLARRVRSGDTDTLSRAAAYFHE